MTEQTNRLTPAESERLYLLLEEMGEVQQMIGKILRFGYDSVHPNGDTANRNRLESELGDVRCILDMMDDKDINLAKISVYAEIKANRIQHYLYHQD